MDKISQKLGKNKKQIRDETTWNLRKHKKSNRARGIGKGCSSADSAGDEESAESMLVGPDADLLGIIGGNAP